MASNIFFLAVPKIPRGQVLKDNDADGGPFALRDASAFFSLHLVLKISLKILNFSFM